MNNTPQKPKRIDTRKNRKKPVSQGRKTLRQLGIEETPLTNPSRYLVYGTLSHKMLSYAQFKKGAYFSASNYQEFLFKKQDSSRINHTLVYLTKIGYLKKSQRPNPPNNQNKNSYIYAVTPLGSHALLFVGRRNREREEAKMRKTLRDSGARGWETKVKNRNP
jgi:hypothetical protein